MNNKWRYVPFTDVFDWCSKSNIGSREAVENGKYKLFVASATEIKRYNEFLENGERIVFGTGGNPCIHYINEAFSYTNHTECARSKSEDVFVKFYYYYFQKDRYKDLQSTFVGGGIKNSSKKKIGSLFVPQIDYDEQKRIVARIEELFSELDKSVETLKKTKAQLAVYRQAVLKEAFDSIAGCDEDYVQSICDNIVDCPHSTPKWTQEGKICLRTTNFKRGYLDLTEKNYVSEETFNTRNARLIPQPGDVLYSREGAILGIACIIPDNLYVCLGQRMMLLRTNSRMINKFLMYYLNSPRVTAYVASITGGSASPHVNVGDIKNFKIPIPSISKQIQLIEEIESRLSVCDSIKTTVDTALQEAEAMRQSILKQAFEGRL